jgi:hypothetical protein
MPTSSPTTPNVPPTSDRGSSCARCSLARVGSPSTEGLTCGCETACGARDCLAPALAAPSYTELEQEIRERLRPADTAVAHATALLEAEPRADLAYVPMCLPGKTYGQWTSGQEVVTVSGVVLIAVNSHDAARDVPSGSWARDTAAAIGRRVLDQRGQDGVAAYAVVRRGERVSVFEDPL